MNERIEELALDAGLLNYVDNETPTRFFVDGHADLEEVQKFAELIIRECMKVATPNYMGAPEDCVYYVEEAIDRIAEHFGVER